ncbi:hypothetical protein FB45DRAFT_894906 [Roridomyces roridus]|uniref:Uncharacterized protein n=1 Tax=Roridomyces roridus TaxID=1738132 RepID=A0AAD7CII3_9AGAR|nr:hypothetical protein FB45DRAFT_894906 [Roridomyces roridus]
MVESADIRPLLELSNLEDLHLYTLFGLCFDDKFGTLMSLAWPRLKTMRLRPKSYPRFVTPPLIPTTAFLVALARNCPHLQALYLDIDISNVSEQYALRSRVRQTALTSLVFYRNTQVVEPVTLAKLLSSLFPSLRAISSVAKDAEKWAVVRTQVATFAEIRAEERQFMLEGNESRLIL